jgi:transcriptional regulator with XRE-family HTH domain
VKRKRGGDYDGPETWGSRYQKRRDELGLSQADIARATGLTQQAISRVENDEVEPRFSTLVVLAAAVGTDVYSIFPADLRPRGFTPAARKAAARNAVTRRRRRNRRGL